MNRKRITDFHQPFHTKQNVAVLLLHTSRRSVCHALIFFALTALISLHTSALIVIESEPNSSLDDAQNINDSFSVGPHFNINYSAEPGWEWVSIDSIEGDDTYDYYKFFAGQGQNYVFDLDYGMNDFDASIGLWAKSGGWSLLHNQDDDCDEFGVTLCDQTDFGSISEYDSRFSWEFDFSGYYVIGVARYFAAANDDGFLGKSPIEDDFYTLQVTREIVPISEPYAPLVVFVAVFLIGAARSLKDISKHF